MLRLSALVTALSYRRNHNHLWCSPLTITVLGGPAPSFLVRSTWSVFQVWPCCRIQIHSREIGRMQSPICWASPVGCLCESFFWCWGARASHSTISVYEFFGFWRWDRPFWWLALRRNNLITFSCLFTNGLNKLNWMWSTKKHIF